MTLTYIIARTHGINKLIMISLDISMVQMHWEKLVSLPGIKEERYYIPGLPNGWLYIPSNTKFSATIWLYIHSRYRNEFQV